jgi:butyryl-CoA dehydrogenase
MDGGAGLKLLAARIQATTERTGRDEALAPHAHALAAALQKVGAATKAAWATGVPEEALANATPYLQAFGHTVLAWIWLDVALAARRLPDASAARGRLAATRYFFAYELPKVDAWLGVVSSREAVCREMDPAWF